MVLPGRERIPLPCPELPELVINAVTAVVVRLRLKADFWLTCWSRPDCLVSTIVCSEGHAEHSVDHGRRKSVLCWLAS